jgi:hypothetical protein
LVFHAAGTRLRSSITVQVPLSGCIAPGIRRCSLLARVQDHTHCSSSATPETCDTNVALRSLNSTFDPKETGLKYTESLFVMSTLGRDSHINGEVRISLRFEFVMYTSAEVHRAIVAPLCSTIKVALYTEGVTMQEITRLITDFDDLVSANDVTTTESGFVTLFRITPKLSVHSSVSEKLAQ